jgi:hypothetical protein
MISKLRNDIYTYNCVFFLLNDSLVSEFYVLMFWNTLFHLHSG